jgi:hypothetical protein
MDRHASQELRLASLRGCVSLEVAPAKGMKNRHIRANGSRSIVKRKAATRESDIGSSGTASVVNLRRSAGSDSNKRRRSGEYRTGLPY